MYQDLDDFIAYKRKQYGLDKEDSKQSSPPAKPFDIDAVNPDSDTHKYNWGYSEEYRNQFKGREAEFDPRYVAPEEPEGSDERGFLGDIGSNLARGAADLTRLGGYALKTIDPDGGADFVERAGQSLVDAADASQEWDIMKQDKGERDGEDGIIKRAFTGAARSSVVSYGPTAAGALTGFALGGPAGAAIGGATAGVLNLFGVLGLGTYGEKMQEFKDKGVNDADAERTAAYEAIIESGGEVVSEVAGFLILGGGSAFTKPLAHTVNEIIKLPAKELAKRLAGSTMIEVATEVMQEGSQAKLESDIGVQKEGAWKHAMVEAIGPAVVMSTLFGAGTSAYTYTRRKQLERNLNNIEDQDAREAAVDEVEQGIMSKNPKDPVAKQNAQHWAKYAADRIAEGQPIELHDNFVSLGALDDEQMAELQGAAIEDSVVERMTRLNTKISNIEKMKRPTPAMLQNRDRFIAEREALVNEVATARNESQGRFSDRESDVLEDEYGQSVDVDRELRDVQRDNANRSFVDDYEGSGIAEEEVDAAERQAEWDSWEADILDQREKANKKNESEDAPISKDILTIAREQYVKTGKISPELSRILNQEIFKAEGTSQESPTDGQKTLDINAELYRRKLANDQYKKRTAEIEEEQARLGQEFEDDRRQEEEYWQGVKSEIERQQNEKMSAEKEAAYRKRFFEQKEAEIEGWNQKVAPSKESPQKKATITKDELEKRQRWFESVARELGDDVDTDVMQDAPQGQRVDPESPRGIPSSKPDRVRFGSGLPNSGIGQTETDLNEETTQLQPDKNQETDILPTEDEENASLGGEKDQTTDLGASQPDTTPEHQAIIDNVENTYTERSKNNIFAELGKNAVPGLRAQEHVEAGRWVYQVAKGEATQEEFDAQVEQWRKENRIRDEKINETQEVNLFQAGREVTYALPQGSSSLRPTQGELAKAAKKLGISVGKARKSLDFFNNGDATQAEALTEKIVIKKEVKNKAEKSQAAEDTSQPKTTPEQVEIKTGIKGRKDTTYLSDNTPVPFEYEIIDASELMTSHDDQMNKNPDYPEALQPRERSRKASILQVEKIANKIIPDKLGENTSAAHGAPIIGDTTNFVESGNGRIAAIRKAYQTGKAEEYRKWLNENRGKFGIGGDVMGTSDIDQMKMPVLVRRRTEAIENLSDFTQKANQEGIAKMSVTEQGVIETLYQQNAPRRTIRLCNRGWPTKQATY
jgi:hypothetical protein